MNVVVWVYILYLTLAYAVIALSLSFHNTFFVGSHPARIICASLLVGHAFGHANLASGLGAVLPLNLKLGATTMAMVTSSAYLPDKRHT